MFFVAKNFAYVYVKSQHMYPKIGKIVDMLSVDNIYIIQLQDCETLYFNSHFNVYAIRHTQKNYFLLI